MIGLDWGTTNLRAYRFHHGRVVDEAPPGPGLLSVPAGGFGQTLLDIAGPWLEAGERRVLLSGMVGSRQGWLEAPYLHCPADPAALAAAAVRVAFRGADVRILPGISCLNEVPEVMRGEEVQIAGILDRIGPDATVCLPGSHSKWVRLQGGAITGFQTALTGEAFAALRRHTILGRLIAEAPHDPHAFNRGLDRAASPGGLLHHLFGVRTLGLFGHLPEAQAGSYLSGLLIGHEVTAAAPGGPVHLVGTPALCALYAAAIARHGGTAHVLDGNAAAAGLARLGKDVAWD